ncbi:MAG: hypothetical protein R3A12_18240 [Ignavibacteria bacterium]
MKTTDGGFNWTVMPNLPVLSANYNTVFASDENNIYLGVASEEDQIKEELSGHLMPMLPGKLILYPELYL